MKRRWWLLGALLVIAVAAGFGIGSAVKSTPSAARSGSLASENSGTGAQATVTRPGAVVPVPPLKLKASQTRTTTSASSSATTSAAVTTTATTVTQTATTPPPSTPTTASHTTVATSTTSGGGGGGG